MATAKQQKRHETDEGAYGYVVLLGLKTFELRNLLRDVARGLPFKTLEHFARTVPLTMAQVLDLVQISPRTVARRKHEARLSPEESDRLLRGARLMAKAAELFEGNMKMAAGWLQAPQVALGGAVPLDVARTELGAREVEVLIERLQHGVFS